MWKIGLILLVAATTVQCATKLQEVFAWNILDYDYPTDQMRHRDIRTRRYLPENNLPVGIEVWQDRLFMSVPRWREGIPATLNYVPLSASSLTKSPRLIPYPSWEANELGNCNSGLTTVYRIKADACNRLWVLDTGTFGIGNTTTNPCPYAINVFDLFTDRRLRRYEFRPEDTNARTFIANIAVDIGPGGCDDTFAYFSDELGYGLIAYSWMENRSWRFEHSFFMPDPLKGDFNIGGLNFQWGEEGIFGMALSPIQPSKYRVLFFSPLASDREFAVSTAILRNSSKVEDSYHDFVVLEERAPLSHTTSRVMSDDGIMFFNLIDRNAVGCWNSQRPYEPANHDVVDIDDEGLIFPADVKVDYHRNVWVISDKMPNFLIDKLDYNDINFRVFFAPQEVLVQDTVCEPERLLTRVRPEAPATTTVKPATITTPAPIKPTREPPQEPPQPLEIFGRLQPLKPQQQLQQPQLLQKPQQLLQAQQQLLQQPQQKQPQQPQQKQPQQPQQQSDLFRQAQKDLFTPPQKFSLFPETQQQYSQAQDIFYQFYKGFGGEPQELLTHSQKILDQQPKLVGQSQKIVHQPPKAQRLTKSPVPQAEGMKPHPHYPHSFSHFIINA